MNQDNYEGLVLNGPMAGQQFSHGDRFARTLESAKFKASMSPGEPPPPDLAAKIVTMQHVEFVFMRVDGRRKAHGYWVMIEDNTAKEDAELRERALTLLEESFFP